MNTYLVLHLVQVKLVHACPKEAVSISLNLVNFEALAESMSRFSHIEKVTELTLMTNPKLNPGLLPFPGQGGF
eukprot:157793-Amorphochlora_amoeboformis.AAC.1